MIINKPKKKKKISRYLGLNIIMFVVFGVILSKILYLQVYKYDDYKEKADVGSTRFISEKAPRGIIYDSEGNVLASNRQTYTLTYTQTTKADEEFYKTMDKVLGVLSQTGEKFADDLLLKLDSNGKFYFDFKTDDSEAKKAVEIRFKRDRGLNEKVEKDLFEDKEGDFTEDEIQQVNNKLLQITPEQTFYELVKIYDLYELTNPKVTKEIRTKYADMTGKQIYDEISQKYSLEQIRNYIVIKDAIKMQSFKGYKAVTIANNIKEETAFNIYQRLNELPGIDVSLEPVRYYPYGSVGAAIMGYVSPIDSSKEKNYELRGYDVSSDLIGMSGIENTFEEQLKGTKGGTTVKVDSKGKITEELFKLESYPGNNVHLTIDKDVQYAADEALKDRINEVNTLVDYEGKSYPSATRGALVAIEVKTGRILALSSYPSFDPNMFAIKGQLTPEQTQQYFSPDLEAFGKDFKKRTGSTMSVDELLPKDENGNRQDVYDIYPRSFYNYATLGLIPPGSTFKPLTGLIGLQEGVVAPGEYIVDRGRFTDHPETFGAGFAPECMIYTTSRGSHGPVDIKKALQVSCNIYFYEIAYRLYIKEGSDIDALNSIAEYAWKFGLGIPPDSKQKPATGIQIEENFGQTYNFESFKNQSISYSMFELVDYLEKGDYRGITYFVPFDISKNEDDSDELKEAKEVLKEKVRGRLQKVGTNEPAENYDEFVKAIKKDIKEITKLSDKYKNNIKVYESKHNTKVSVSDEIDTIANVIARFTINDKASEITSPAQLVYDSIGQGINNFTPVQIANYVATLANGGTRYKLSLVDKVTSPEGEVLQEFKPEVIEKIDIDSKFLQQIKEGMYLVNHTSDGGTANEMFGNFPIKVVGKTGTADFTTSYDEIGRRPYANYISFAPMDDPEIAVFCTIYDAGRGSFASPPTKAVYEAYFKDELLKLDPNYASKSATFKKYVVDAPKDNKENSSKKEN